MILNKPKRIAGMRSHQFRVRRNVAWVLTTVYSHTNSERGREKTMGHTYLSVGTCAVFASTEQMKPS